MIKLNLTWFWVVLIFILFSGAVGFTSVIYKVEHQKILKVQKNNVISKIKSLEFVLISLINNKNINDISDLLDSEIVLNDLFKNIFVVYKDKVIVSSNRNLINKPFDNISFTDFNEFINAKEISFKEVIHIDLSNFDFKTEKEHYSLFIELDTKNLDSELTLRHNQLLFYSALASVLMLLLLIAPFSFFITNPINIMIDKINNDNVVKSNFCLNELDILDKDIVEAFNKIKQHSYTDELTGLYNRKLFNSKLEELIANFSRYDTPFSFLIFDIDNFKKVNDTFGHQEGDNVLIKISSVIQNIIRENDILFRIGGEEFVILFNETNLGDALNASEKIRVAVANTKIIENHKITISLGLTQVIDTDTSSTIVSRADKFLYQAKTTGKNKVIYK